MPSSSAKVLDYASNNFSSVSPNFTLYLSYTSYLSMSKNSISGHIPISICNSILEVLDLSHNYFRGPVPSCLIESTQLQVLNLRENHFEGTLPSNITAGCGLQTIDLHGNKIEGQLPRGLSNCTDLEVLDFGDNRIADTFPSWLRGLPHLSVIVLRSNQFYGSICDLVCYNKSDESFSSLQIIDLASNKFSGNLTSQWFEKLESMMGMSGSTGEILVSAQRPDYPGGFYQDSVEIVYKGSEVSFEKILTTLTAIDFSSNRLEGTIPESIGTLVSLRMLNMSNNAFTGKIPAELGSMTDLESLDLSCNQLSGVIPQELTNLTFLGVLNLSNNHLVGKIPQSRQFSTFSDSSFGGNAGLCGPPLSKLPCGYSPHTPSAAQVNRSSNHVDVVLFLFAGLGFGVGFAAAVLVKWDRVGRWFTATIRGWQT